MSNLLFRTWNSLAVCSFYETSPFSGANIRTYTVHLSIWVRASRHDVWRVSEHTCCYPGIFRCRFHFFFRSRRKSWGGSGFFSNKSFILWFVQLWSVIKPLIQTHIHCYNKARKGTGISLEIALGSNRKNAWKSKQKSKRAQKIIRKK